MKDNVVGSRSTIGISRRSIVKASAGTIGLLGLSSLTGCSGSSQSKLTIWWTSGQYEAENTAMQEIVAAWEEESGHKADLQFYGNREVGRKLLTAFGTDTLPDVAYGGGGTQIDQFAFEDKLADMASVVSAADLLPGLDATSMLLNGTKGERGSYAVPVASYVVPMFLWGNMLADAGVDTSSLPEDWYDYWTMLDEVADDASSRMGSRVYGVGWPLSSANADTGASFRQALTGFDVDILNEDGDLAIADRNVRDGIGDTLEFVTKLYTEGSTPPDSINWDGAGNNQSFLNQSIVSTSNGTLSIPGSIRDDAPDLWNDVITTGWPDSVSGARFRTNLLTIPVIVPKDAKNVDEGRDFVKFMLRPENQQKWLEAANARFMPAVSETLDKDYWSKSDDPNIAAVVRLLEGPTQPDPTTVNGPYRNAENADLWGDAIGDIVVNDVSLQEAVENVVERLEAAVRDFRE